MHRVPLPDVLFEEVRGTSSGAVKIGPLPASSCTLSIPSVPLHTYLYQCDGSTYLRRVPKLASGTSSFCLRSPSFPLHHWSRPVSATSKFMLGRPIPSISVPLFLRCRSTQQIAYGVMRLLSMSHAQAFKRMVGTRTTSMLPVNGVGTA